MKCIVFNVGQLYPGKYRALIGRSVVRSSNQHVSVSLGRLTDVAAVCECYVLLIEKKFI